MNKIFKIWQYVLIGVLACIVVLKIHSSCERHKQGMQTLTAQSTEFYAWLRFNKSELRDAVAAVEGGDTLGLTQICLDDYNRIMQTNFTLQTVDPDEIFREYPEYWINRFEIPNTPENYTRIWNGGPRGYEKRSTDEYWHLIQITLEAQRRQRNEIHR